MTPNVEAALRLHRFMLEHHWDGGVIAGPDPGVRFNARAGRFLKSYSRRLPWSDELVYMQAQGYWAAANQMLADRTGERRYREIATDCCEAVLRRQTPEGFWPYPNPEWRDRVATVEGCYASLALLEGFERLGRDRFLEGALAWHRYMVDEIGFRSQPGSDMLAVNYFAHSTGSGGGVPNNSTLVLAVLARYSEVTGDDRFLEHAEPLIHWLRTVQKSTGEFPYAIGPDGIPTKSHFLCYQYHGFEFADLATYQRITGDKAVLPIMEGVARFLSDALAPEGYARRDCQDSRVEVVYYTAAVANALALATDMGLGDYQALSERAYERVRRLQRPEGDFRFYSRRNYGLLTDRRSYPRYLAMILKHLLKEAPTYGGGGISPEEAS